MKWAVIGSRGLQDWNFFREELDEILKGKAVECLVSGGADGADTFAERYGRECGIPIVVFPADWEQYGAKAGPLRNRQIVAYCDILVAFWDGTSHGTRTTMDLAQAAGKDVVVVMAR